MTTHAIKTCLTLLTLIAILTLANSLSAADAPFTHPKEITGKRLTPPMSPLRR